MRPKCIKSVILAFVLCLCISASAYAEKPLFLTSEGAWQHADVDFIDLTSNHENSLAKLVTDIGESSHFVMIDSIITQDDNVTIPGNITVWIPNGNGITIASGTVVRFDNPGQINAGPYQIFNGDGLVRFTYPGKVVPEWWRTNTAPGTTDMASAISAAINSGGQIVQLADTTYAVRPATSFTLESGVNLCVAPLVSGLRLLGDGNSTLFVPNNYSTRAAPVRFNILCANQHVRDIVIDGVTFDLNGDSNSISPDAENGAFNTGYNTASVIVSGNASISDSKIINSTFKHTPGCSVIVLAQTNDEEGIALGKNIEIAGNTFVDNGIDTNDHSSVYAWADDVKIHHNTFRMSSPSYGGYVVNGRTGPLIAVELHGSSNDFSHNYIKNYMQGVWISNNITSISKIQKIVGNTFEVGYSAADMWIQDEGLKGISDVLISDNVIWLTYELYPNAPAYEALMARGIGIQPLHGATNIHVANNSINGQRDNSRGSWGVLINAVELGYTLKNVVVENNRMANVSIGVGLVARDNGTYDDIMIRNNTIMDPVVGNPLQANPMGFYVLSGEHTETIDISGNVVTDSNSTAEADYGIFIESESPGARISKLIMYNNVFSGLSSNLEIISDVTTRYGEWLHLEGQGIATGAAVSIVNNSSVPLTVTAVAEQVAANISNFSTNVAPLHVFTTSANNYDVVPTLQQSRRLDDGVNGSNGQGISNVYFFKNDAGDYFAGCFFWIVNDNATAGREDVSLSIWCSDNGTPVQKWP